MARDHAAYRDEAGAYLLGALSELEQRAFERHLAGCSDCRDEVKRLQVAADALPRSATPVVPPDTLKRSLMDVVERDAARAEGRDGLVARLGARLRGLTPTLAGMRPTVAWVSASFLLAVGIAFGVLAGTQLGGEDPRTVAATPDSQRMPFGSGSLVVSGDEKKGAILKVHGMADLRDDRVYQVWLRRDGEVVSQSIFRVGAEGNGAAAVPDDLRGADAVLVTREPSGGARAPSEKPVLSVRL